MKRTKSTILARHSSMSISVFSRYLTIRMHMQRAHMRHDAFSSYAVSELQKDVERELEALPEAEREAKRTKFAVFVVHNKLKPKLAELPADIP